MFRRSLTLALLLLLALAAIVRADDGSGARAEWRGDTRLAHHGIAAPAPAVVGAADCRTYSYSYDAGKTVEGFQAEATDGCNVARWTGSIGQGPGGGTYTFKTNGHNGYSWQDGYGLPRYGDDQQSCLARAAQEANAYFTNYFKVAPGTEVTVKYHCD
jgi:hypothetical protein